MSFLKLKLYILFSNLILIQFDSLVSIQIEIHKLKSIKTNTPKLLHKYISPLCLPFFPQQMQQPQWMNCPFHPECVCGWVPLLKFIQDITFKLHNKTAYGATTKCHRAVATMNGPGKRRIKFVISQLTNITLFCCRLDLASWGKWHWRKFSFFVVVATFKNVSEYERNQ